MSRSSFDQQMQRNHNPYREDYHAPPWPEQQYRTEFDKELQQQWCPKCGGGGAHPLTPFSFACSPGIGCHKLQEAPGPGRYSNYAVCAKNCKTPDGPGKLGGFSYACSPGIGCHLLQQPPAMAGTLITQPVPKTVRLLTAQESLAVSPLPVPLVSVVIAYSSPPAMAVSPMFKHVLSLAQPHPLIPS